jgi:hypothetical protein
VANHRFAANKRDVERTMFAHESDDAFDEVVATVVR